MEWRRTKDEPEEDTLEAAESASSGRGEEDRTLSDDTPKADPADGEPNPERDSCNNERLRHGSHGRVPLLNEGKGCRRRRPVSSRSSDEDSRVPRRQSSRLTTKDVRPLSSRPASWC